MKRKVAKCYMTIIKLVLYGCETWSLTGGWRKLHNEELHNLYSSPSTMRMITSRRMRWTRHVARMGIKLNACRILLGMPEGKMSLRWPRRRWVSNFKMDLREIGWGGMDWIDLAEDRDQWRGEYGNEPSGSINCWEVLEWLYNWQLVKKRSAPWS
jgi:hypothetical protein